MFIARQIRRRQNMRTASALLFALALSFSVGLCLGLARGMVRGRKDASPSARAPGQLLPVPSPSPRDHKQDETEGVEESPVASLPLAKLGHARAEAPEHATVKRPGAVRENRTTGVIWVKGRVTDMETDEPIGPGTVIIEDRKDGSGIAVSSRADENAAFRVEMGVVPEGIYYCTFDGFANHSVRTDAEVYLWEGENNASTKLPFAVTFTVRLDFSACDTRPRLMLPILTGDGRLKKVPSVDRQSAKATFLNVLPGRYKLTARLPTGYELEEEPTIVVDRQHFPGDLVLRVRQSAKEE